MSNVSPYPIANIISINHQYCFMKKDQNSAFVDKLLGRIGINIEAEAKNNPIITAVILASSLFIFNKKQ
jgi:hypothetical protein